MARIYGTAKRSDGSNIDRTIRITTSWNDNTAYPRNGEYSLDLGSNPQREVTIYVDGMTYKTMYIDGNVRLDIRL